MGLLIGPSCRAIPNEAENAADCYSTKDESSAKTAKEAKITKKLAFLSFSAIWYSAEARNSPAR
jgi:hypothetical protein